MPKADTSIIDLHAVTAGPCPVLSVIGEAWFGPEEDDEFEMLSAGDEVKVGHAIMVAAGAKVELPGLTLKGGNQGRAHALVLQSRFQPSPNRDDVPRLITQLQQIEREMKPSGEDPLRMQSGPMTAAERSQSAEFVWLNFDPEVAQLLQADDARRLGAVCIFISEETAFVAADDLTVPKLRELMQILDRPVNPHIVESVVLLELLARAYGDRSLND